MRPRRGRPVTRASVPRTARWRCRRDADAAIGRAGDGDTAEAGQCRLDPGRAQQVVHRYCGKAFTKRVTAPPRADRPRP